MPSKLLWVNYSLRERTKPIAAIAVPRCKRKNTPVLHTRQSRLFWRWRAWNYGASSRSMVKNLPCFAELSGPYVLNYQWVTPTAMQITLSWVSVRVLELSPADLWVC